MEYVLPIILASGVLFYGFRWWQNRKIPHYSPSEADNRVRDGRHAVLLDVRTERERRSSQIRGSLHIPLHELRSRLDELKKVRDKEIICYCQSGNRSVSAASFLLRNGFKAANLRGGIGEWNFAHRDKKGQER